MLLLLCFSRCPQLSIDVFLSCIAAKFWASQRSNYSSKGTYNRKIWCHHKRPFKLRHITLKLWESTVLTHAWRTTVFSLKSDRTPVNHSSKQPLPKFLEFTKLTSLYTVFQTTKMLCHTLKRRKWANCHNLSPWAFIHSCSFIALELLARQNSTKVDHFKCKTFLSQAYS